MFLYEDSPEILNSLEVFGILEVQSDPNKDFIIKIKYLYVSGAFIAGSENEPFKGQLSIIMYGDESTPDYEIRDPPFSDGTQMGSKAIGILRYFVIIIRNKAHKIMSKECNNIECNNIEITPQDSVIRLSTNKTTHFDEMCKLYNSINILWILVDLTFFSSLEEHIQTYHSLPWVNLPQFIVVKTRFSRS